MVSNMCSAQENSNPRNILYEPLITASKSNFVMRGLWSNNIYNNMSWGERSKFSQGVSLGRICKGHEFVVLSIQT
jgi:hypothetical protein